MGAELKTLREEEAHGKSGGQTPFPSSAKLTVAIWASHRTLCSLLLRWRLDKDVKSGMDRARLGKPEICSFLDFIQKSPTKALQDTPAAPMGKAAKCSFLPACPPLWGICSSAFSLHSLSSRLPQIVLPAQGWHLQCCAHCLWLQKCPFLHVNQISPPW